MKITDTEYLNHVWIHEIMRVFNDRLIDEKDSLKMIDIFKESI